MVIDTSAFVAIFQNEPEREDFIRAIESSSSRNVSVVASVEISIILESRYGLKAVQEFDLFVTEADIQFREVDSIQARAARNAYSQFGKGRHPANLNICDCFSYALARVLDQPLLFKGEDFTKTDIRRFPTWSVHRATP